MRKTLIFLSLIIIGLCTACGDSRAEKDKKAKRELQIQDSLAMKIGTLPTFDCMPLFVAKERGLFDSLGVDIRLRQFRAQMDCDTALAGGSVQGSVTDLVRAERLQRRGTALVYKTATDSYWQLITNRKQRINQLSDLSDKMIAMARYSVTDLMATHAIAKGKLKNPAFKVQINDVIVRLSMLQNNEMDAMVLTEPQAAAARLYKNPVLLDTRDEGWRMGVIAFRRKDLADDHRSRQFQLLVRAYDTACDSLNKYGVVHYADVAEKYCRADRRTIKSLNKYHFSHMNVPRPKDVETARQWLNTLENKR